MARKDIIQELNDLGSSLAKTTPQNPYSVSEGYFEGFARQVLGRIKAGEKGLEFLSSLPKEAPYQVPVEYFEGLPENIMRGIREHADYQTSQEELASISPLLSTISKKPVFSVPDGYFENFEVAIDHKPKALVVSIASRRWLRLAAAAVVTGIIAVGSILIINSNNKIDPQNNPEAWVKKNVIKKVNPEVITEFVKLTDEELPLKDVANNKPEDIKELMKDVPVNEIDKFLNETGASEETETDALMN